MEKEENTPLKKSSLSVGAFPSTIARPVTVPARESPLPAEILLRPFGFISGVAPNSKLLERLDLGTGCVRRSTTFVRCINWLLVFADVGCDAEKKQGLAKTPNAGESPYL